MVVGRAFWVKRYVVCCQGSSIHGRSLLVHLLVSVGYLFCNFGIES